MHHYGTNVCGDGGVALLDAGGALLKLLVKSRVSLQELAMPACTNTIPGIEISKPAIEISKPGIENSKPGTERPGCRVVFVFS